MFVVYEFCILEFVLYFFLLETNEYENEKKCVFI